MATQKKKKKGRQSTSAAIDNVLFIASVPWE